MRISAMRVLESGRHVGCGAIVKGIALRNQLADRAPGVAQFPPRMIFIRVANIGQRDDGVRVRLAHQATYVLLRTSSAPLLESPGCQHPR
jgi:hypothetical protein